MKSTLKAFYTAALFLAFFAIVQTALADGPPPPPPGGGHGGGGNQPPGGGAPIGGGLGILIALGAAYAGKKIYLFKNKDLPVK
jgi:hypothetical protein